MLEARGELDLALEAVDVDVGCGFRGEDFDDDFAAEGVFLGDGEAGHTAAAELALEGVGGGEGLLELVEQVRRHRRCSGREAVREWANVWWWRVGYESPSRWRARTSADPDSLGSQLYPEAPVRSMND